MKNIDELNEFIDLGQEVLDLAEVYIQAMADEIEAIKWSKKTKLDFEIAKGNYAKFKTKSESKHEDNKTE